MSIGISEEHDELAASLRRWAAALGGPELSRSAEDDVAARFDEAWKAAGEMGVPAILADGGSPLDQAVALEACAHELVPGPLLGPVVAGSLLEEVPDGALVGLCLDPDHSVVWDAPSATHLLVGDSEDRWHLVPADAATVTPSSTVDLSRRFGSAEVDLSAAGVRVSLSLVTTSVKVQLTPGGSHPQKSVTPAVTRSARSGSRLANRAGVP